MHNIQQCEAMNIVGLEVRTSNARAFETIPAHWRRFHGDEVLARISDKVSDDVYAVYTGFENEGESNEGLYSFIIGVRVHDIGAVPVGLSGVVVPAARRAVFAVERGHPELVGEQWRKIWLLADLPKSFICDYERYQSNGDIDVFVGVR